MVYTATAEASGTRRLRDRAEKRWRAMIERRRTWFDWCREIAAELMPAKLPYLTSDYGPRHRAGDILRDAKTGNAKIVDATGHTALNTAAASLVSGSMPANVSWFALLVRGQFGRDWQLRSFLQEVEQRMRATINQTNANNVWIQYCEELLAFGTAAALFLDDEDDVFRIDPLSAGEYCIEEDARGRVDTLYRRLTMTVAQLEQEFGYEKLSRSTQHAFDLGNYDLEVLCVHAIEPDRGGDNPSMPWRSLYYEEQSDTGDLLALRYFAKFPALVTRWKKLTGTPYGYGPGMDALPHLVRLRKQVYAYALALELKNRPPLQLPAGVSQHEVRSLPGGRTTRKNPGGEPITTLFEVDVELSKLQEDIDKSRQDVRDSLGSSLVASLRSVRHQMTATEVEERRVQDATEYLPGIFRMHEELHSNFIELTWDAMDDRAMLPELPSVLREGVIDIEFTSPLARKQREYEVDAIVQTFALVGELAKQRPDAWDNLDINGGIQRVAEVRGVPTQAIVPIEQVQQVQAARAQAQQAEQMAAASQQAAEIAETASKAESNLRLVG